VRNLEDEVSVEIIAEGEENNLNEFLKLINIHDYVIQVEKIEVKEEKATGEFKYFKILRGEPTEELGERLDVAGKVLYKIAEQQNQTINAINSMHKDMTTRFDQTISAINSMHKDMTTRFDIMEQKYGKISANLERISVALEVLAGIKPKKES